MASYKMNKKAALLEAEYQKNLKIKGFEEERQKWEQILESEGLGLIENENPPRAKAAIASYEQTTEYYAAAMEYYNTATFTNAFEKRVWFLHASGCSVREIGRILKTKSVRAVHSRIKRVRERMLNSNPVPPTKT